MIFFTALRSFLLAIFVVVLSCANVRAMEKQQQNAMDYSALDTVLLETVQIVAEMCYRKKVDLDNDKIFDCTSEREFGRKKFFSQRDIEAVNIFNFNEWKKVYPEGIEKLIEDWGDVFVMQEAEKFDKKLQLLDFVIRLQPASKVQVLQQLKGYSSSFGKIVKNGLYSLTSCTAAAGSIYLIFKLENQKLKALSAASCLVFSLAAWYFAQKTKTAITNYSWWKNCINFQQAIALCK